MAQHTSQRQQVSIDGRTLQLSNLSKVLYPQTDTTKAHVIEYYTRIAPTMLAHLRDRPITLKRFPNGVEGEFFYEKNCPSHRPDWVATASLESDSRGGRINYCLVNDLPSLVWAANLAAIELHPNLHLANAPDQPTVIAMDLDPGPPARLTQCARVAVELRDVLEQFDLQCFVKASGGKGLHLYIPINTPTDYTQTKTFARSLAMLMEKRDRNRVTSVMAKAKRVGKVFIDWSQNTQHKTTVGAYSLRAQPTPTVSLPLLWDEVEALADERLTADELDLSPNAALRRVDEHGDLFAPMLDLQQELLALRL